MPEMTYERLLREYDTVSALATQLDDDLDLVRAALSRAEQERDELRRALEIALADRDFMWKVEVYPVGWLSAIRHAYQQLTRPDLGRYQRRSNAWRMLRGQWRYTVRQVRARNWRAVKNSFNGYLAEPDEFPPGDYRRRCGSGWTKGRALRSLERRLP